MAADFYAKRGASPGAPKEPPRPLGFSDGLTLLFIGLRLTHQINWPWIWVIMPFLVAVILRTALDGRS